MEFLKNIKEPYQAVLDEEWADMEKFYTEDVMGFFALSCPISVDKDTAFHLAVYSGREQPLKSLLEFVEKDNAGLFGSEAIFMGNIYENTVLHEAAISGNLDAVQILVSKFPKLVNYTNKSGETPLFRASAFGKTKIVKYLASQQHQVVRTGNGESHLQDIHRQRKDGASILHVAVQGEHFGTALGLLELDKGLANLKYRNGTSLYMLAKIPSVFQRGRKMNIFKKLLYNCLPVSNDHHDEAENIEHMEEAKNEQTNSSGNDSGEISIYLPVDDDHNDEAKNIEHKEEARNEQTNSSGIDNGYLSKVSNCIYPICRLIIGGSSILGKLWKEKRHQKFAHDLAVKLIENDKSWEQSIADFTATPYEADKHKSSEQSTTGSSITTNEDAKREEEKDHSPLFAAAKTGNTKLVKMILKEHPQALEYKSRKMKQNILHVAVKYRQKEIFKYVKSKRVPMLRLVRQIDEQGYTILHSVADTKHYIEGTGSGPAYQLQEELEWFNDVEKLMPTHYKMFLAIDKSDKTKKITAMGLFKKNHAEQLKKAQQWIKETSQSCSGVAVLVATVVFAAAFTVPGGTNDINGRPILLHSPLFLFFTITDVVSLSCSLTAVVMFLSIVTSPFELDQFLVSLPRRLTLGFALLFMSVATTMLAFTSTIFLIIHLERRRQWTMTLICSAAFFPVSVLALTHFPLFVSFLKAWKSLFMFVRKALPCSLVLPKNLSIWRKWKLNSS